MFKKYVNLIAGLFMLTISIQLQAQDNQVLAKELNRLTVDSLITLAVASEKSRLAVQAVLEAETAERSKLDSATDIIFWTGSGLYTAAAIGFVVKSSYVTTESLLSSTSQATPQTPAWILALDDYNIVRNVAVVGSVSIVSVAIMQTEKKHRENNFVGKEILELNNIVADQVRSTVEQLAFLTRMTTEEETALKNAIYSKIAQQRVGDSSVDSLNLLELAQELKLGDANRIAALIDLANVVKSNSKLIDAKKRNQQSSKEEIEQLIMDLRYFSETLGKTIELNPDLEDLKSLKNEIDETLILTIGLQG